MKLVNLSHRIYEEIDSSKRVSKCPFEEAELKMFLGFIDYINHNLGDYVSFVDAMVDADNFKLPVELVGLFYPSRIVFNPDMERSCVNLIDKQPIEIDGGKIAYDYSRLVQFVNKLYATFRKSPNYTESLRDIRRVVSLSNYVGNAAWKGKVIANYSQDAIPVPLNYRFYDEYVYNMSADDYCIIAVRNIISKLTR
jgi:hypothetical protein